MSTDTNEPLTKEGLKVMSLREQVAKLAAQYEDQIADLRVELTIISQERDFYKEKVESAGLLEEPDTTTD